MNKKTLIIHAFGAVIGALISVILELNPDAFIAAFFILFALADAQEPKQ